jgi:hypothetical protein
LLINNERMARWDTRSGQGIIGMEGQLAEGLGGRTTHAKNLVSRGQQRRGEMAKLTRKILVNQQDAGQRAAQVCRNRNLASTTKNSRKGLRPGNQDDH